MVFTKNILLVCLLSTLGTAVGASYLAYQGHFTADLQIVENLAPEQNTEVEESLEYSERDTNDSAFLSMVEGNSQASPDESTYTTNCDSSIELHSVNYEEEPLDITEWIHYMSDEEFDRLLEMYNQNILLTHKYELHTLQQIAELDPEQLNELQGIIEDGTWREEELREVVGEKVYANLQESKRSKMSASIGRYLDGVIAKYGKYATQNIETTAAARTAFIETYTEQALQCQQSHEAMMGVVRDALGSGDRNMQREGVIQLVNATKDFQENYFTMEEEFRSTYFTEDRYTETGYADEVLPPEVSMELPREVSIELPPEISMEQARIEKKLGLTKEQRDSFRRIEKEVASGPRSVLKRAVRQMRRYV